LSAITISNIFDIVNIDSKAKQLNMDKTSKLATLPTRTEDDRKTPIIKSI
jgi:hypothetical protein